MFFVVKSNKIVHRHAICADGADTCLEMYWMLTMCNCQKIQETFKNPALERDWNFMLHVLQVYYSDRT
jgi:hypothetical protein